MGDVDAKMGSIGRTKEELNDVLVNISPSHFADGEDDQHLLLFFFDNSAGVRNPIFRQAHHVAVDIKSFIFRSNLVVPR